jgi:hypothetical protein
VLGAAEIATGDVVTGFLIQPGASGNATLAVFNANKIYMLYGNDISDWNLVEYREEIGGYKYTQQQLAYSIYVDDRGLNNLRTAQEYGNFQHASLSYDVKRFLDTRGSTATASCVVRDKNQYRVFFSDLTALYVTMDGAKIRGMCPIRLEHLVNCIWSGETSGGMEAIYFGSSDGFVYQLDKGTSFDGANIEAYAQLHFWYLKSLGYDKTFFSAFLEAKGSGYAEFNLGYSLDYNSVYTAQPNDTTQALNFDDVRWDSFIWDAFVWDGQTLGDSRVSLNGTAENIGFIIRKDSSYMEPVLFSGIRVRNILRKMKR